MINFTSPRATLTGFGSAIFGSLFATVVMALPVTSRISFILDPGFGAVPRFSGGLLASP
jgi:hypothetical protein